MLRTVDPTIVIAGVVGLLGPSGLVWVALRFNREDAKSAVGTMREVSEQLRLELERAHKENEALRAEVVALRAECGTLSREVSLLRRSNEGRP